MNLEADRITERGDTDRKAVRPSTIHEKNRSSGSGWAVLALAVAFVLVWLSYAVVIRQDDSAFVRALTRVVPIPSVIVNGSSVSYAEFLERRDWIRWQYEKGAEDGYAADEDDLTNQALEMLVRQKAIEQLSERFGVSVSKERFDEEMALVAGELSEVDFEGRVRDELRMSEKEFLDEILTPLLLVQELENAILNDDETQREPRLKADDARAALDSGRDIADVAKEYSDQANAESGADMGYFTAGTVRDGWSAALPLEAGEYSEVIETSDAFVILYASEAIGTEDNATYRLLAIVVEKVGVNDAIDNFLETSDIVYIIHKIE